MVSYSLSVKIKPKEPRAEMKVWNRAEDEEKTKSGIAYL
jgi:hypothetical protein